MVGMQNTELASSSLRVDAQRPIESPLSYKMALTCLGLFALAYVTNAMDRQIFPMLLPWINKTYNFSLASAGLMSTVFTLGIGLSAWPMGYLLDRHSRKAILLWGMVIYSVFTMLTIFAFGFVDMLIYRAMTGVGEAMQIAALFAAAGSYFYKNKALVIGTVNFGYGVGAFIGPFIGTSLTLATNDWRIPFIFYAVLGIVMAGVLYYFVPKSFTESKGPVTTDAVSLAAVENIPPTFWNRNSILAGIAAVLWGFCLYGYMGLYSTFLISELHYAPMVAGASFGMFGLGGMFGIPAGWLGDRYSNRWISVGAWCCIAVVCYLMYNVVVDPWYQRGLSFMVGLLFTSTLHANLMTLAQRSVRPEFVGRATGYFSSCGFSAAAVAGFVFAVLVANFGWGGAELVQMTLCPIIAVVALLLIKDSELLQTPESLRKMKAARA